MPTTLRIYSSQWYFRLDGAYRVVKRQELQTDVLKECDSGHTYTLAPKGRKTLHLGGRRGKEGTDSIRNHGNKLDKRGLWSVQGTGQVGLGRVNEVEGGAVRAEKLSTSNLNQKCRH